MGRHPGLKLDALDLRALAEVASSLRGPTAEPSYLVSTRSGDSLVTKVEKDLPPPELSAVTIPLDTPFVQPNRPAMPELSIGPAGTPQSVSLNDYDALFWSESAVEKFVFPYYASKSEWDAAHVLAALSRAFYGYVPAPGTERVEAPADTIPFAVGHLPRSDYEMVGETGIIDTLHLLFRDESGNVWRRPLSDYL